MEEQPHMTGEEISRMRTLSGRLLDEERGWEDDSLIRPVLLKKLTVYEPNGIFDGRLCFKIIFIVILMILVILCVFGVILICDLPVKMVRYFETFVQE